MANEKPNNETEMWSLHYTVLSIKGNDRTVVRDIDFQAKNDQDAKAKILEILKRNLAKAKWTKDRLLSVMAAPHIEVEGRGRGLDGDRMIRNKHSYSGPKILRTKNPELALVQGYGPEAQKKLHD